MHSSRMRTARSSTVRGGVSVTVVSLIQRPPLERDPCWMETPPDREPSWTEAAPWTEIPHWTETPHPG